MTVGAMGAAAEAAGSAAVQGLQMLNPQRWAGNNTIPDGYSQRFDDGDTLFEIGAEDDEDDEPAPSIDNPVERSVMTPKPAPQPPVAKAKPSWGTLDLFLSLDVALELIHTDRESLKRVDAFAAYPGRYGYKVQDAIEEVFILMLQALAERHLRVGFERFVQIVLESG